MGGGLVLRFTLVRLGCSLRMPMRTWHSGLKACAFEMSDKNWMSGLAEAQEVTW